MSDRGTPPPDDEDDFSFDWLDDNAIVPQDDDLDLFSPDESTNIYGDRERDEGIGQAQYNRIVSRRMEDSIEKAEQADFGDTDNLLDWMAQPEATNADLPEWLRDMPTPQATTQEAEAARLSVLGDGKPEEIPSWLESVSFEQPADIGWVAHTGMTGDLSGDVVPQWTPRMNTGDLTSDTGDLIERVVGTDSLPGSDDWMSKTRFDDSWSADQDSTSASSLSFEDFGLGGVEPLRTEEVPVVRADALDEDFEGFAAPQPEGAEPQPASDFDPDLFGFADFTPYEEGDERAIDTGNLLDPTPLTTQEPEERDEVWEAILRNEFEAYVPPAPQPVADLDNAWDDFDFETASPAEDDDDAYDDAPLLDDSQPLSLSDQLNDADLFALLDDEASSTLPRNDYNLATDNAPVENDIPDWLRGDSPATTDDQPDWLSDFELSDALDPLEDLRLPDMPTDSISDLESTGQAPQWLSRLSTSEELPQVDSSYATSADPYANIDSLFQDTQPAGSSDELDALLEQMRLQQETEQEAPSYREMFDSNLFDKSSIAELDDDSDPTRSDSSLDDLFASGLFDTSELDALDIEPTAARADLRDIFDASDEMPAGFAVSDSGLVTDSDLPAWLQGAQRTSGGSQLAASLRSQEDKPLATLDDRLLALREEGMSVGGEEDSNSGLISEILPGVPEVLAPASFEPTITGVASAVVLTPEQQKRADLLKALVDGDADTLGARRTRRQWLPWLRAAVMVLLAVGVLLPLLINIPVNVNPSAVFAADSRQEAALQTLNALPSGSRVLVAFEYTAAEAPELDDVTRVLLRQLQLRGAIPLVISGDSVGIERAQTLLEQVFPGGANRDYYLTRFVAGGTVGLRALNPSAFNTDTEGIANGLNVQSWSDLAAGIVISASAETVRSYAEQVIPQARIPFVLAVAYGALPGSLPYYTAGRYVGVIAGTRDALVYRAALGEGVFVAPPAATTPEAVLPSATATDSSELVPPPVATIRASATPRPVRTATATEVVTSESTADSVLPLEGVATETAGNTPTRVNTTVATPAPTEVSTRSATRVPATTVSTAAPSATQTSAVTPRATTSATSEATVRVGTIIASGTINVREAPNSDTAAVVATLEPEQVVRVLNYNDDRSWVSVVLPDNAIGWVASFLIRVEERPQSETDFRKLPASYTGDQATPDAASIQVGTVIVDGPLPVLDRAEAAAGEIAQVGRGDEVRVLVVVGDYASVVLSDGRIGYIESFALDIATRPALAANDLSAPGLTLVPATSTPRATRTPRPTGTPVVLTSPTLPATTPVATDAAPVLPGTDQNVQADGGARWQSQVFGLVAALILIIIGNLFYLVRGLSRRGRRSV